MADINISAVDLNLLVVLDAVLEERSATRAAARLHVTQSAVSSALRRLRALFDDALVVRTAYGFVPTPRALALAPMLRTLLRDARGLFAEPRRDRADFSARVFCIACTDAIGVTLLPSLLRELPTQLPGARLRVIGLDRLLASDGLARGEVDLLVGIPPTLPAGCQSELLYEDPLVCIVRAEHPSVGKRLSLDQYAALPHVELALFGEPDERVDRALARSGRTRSVQLAVPHFSNVPFAIAASDCVATLSKRLALSYSRSLRLRMLKPPIELPSLRIHQLWHRRTTRDAGVLRLRALLRKLAS